MLRSGNEDMYEKTGMRLQFVMESVHAVIRAQGVTRIRAQLCDEGQRSRCDQDEGSACD